MKNIFANADDFGLSSSVNKAIVELFDKKLIYSTTLMANMPAFDEAVELACKHELTNKIGIHLVLTEGSPLTEEIKSINFLFKGKTSFKVFKHLIFIFKKKYQKLIYNEFAAQIEKLQSKNIPITHIDTHHHVHEVYIITRILLELQKKYKIPSIRILNNLQKSSKLYKKIYRNLINNYIKRNHANHSDFFGNQADFLLKLKENPTLIEQKTIEIMVHPDYNSDGKLIDKAGDNEYDLIFLQSLKINIDQ